MAERLRNAEFRVDFLEELRKAAWKARSVGSCEIEMFGRVEADFLSRALARCNGEREDIERALLEQFIEEEDFKDLVVCERVLVSDPDPRYRLTVYFLEQRSNDV